MAKTELGLKAGDSRNLLNQIRSLIEDARRQTAAAVNVGAHCSLLADREPNPARNPAYVASLILFLKWILPDRMMDRIIMKSMQ
jgi:hypothetical protein